MADIFVGNNPDAGSRNVGFSASYTFLMSGSALAAGNGIIDMLHMRMYNSVAGTWTYGLFKFIGGTTWECRSAVDWYLGGGLGGWQAKACSLAVGIGDALGLHGAGGANAVVAASTPLQTQARSSTASGNRVIVGLQTDFVALANQYYWRIYGTGYTTGGKLYLGGLASAKRMRPGIGF